LGSLSQASLCAIDTTKSGAVRAPTPSRTPPTSPPKCDSRGTRQFQPVLAYQDLIWGPTSTSSNRSCRKLPIPQVQLSRQDRHLPTRMHSPKAVAVAHNQHTSTSSITTAGVRLLRSSLAVLVLQSSLHRTSVDLRITLVLVVPAATTTPTPTPLTTTTSTLQTGEHDLVPHLVNPNPEASNRLTPCKM